MNDVHGPTKEAGARIFRIAFTLVKLLHRCYSSPTISHVPLLSVVKSLTSCRSPGNCKLSPIPSLQKAEHPVATISSELMPAAC